MNRTMIAGTVLALFLCVGNTFALPTSYDFFVRECDDPISRPLVLGDTLSFDYWFSYTGKPTPADYGSLTLSCLDLPVLIYEGEGYGGGFTTLGEVTSRYESTCWRTASIDVPFWSLYDHDWNRRTDPHNVVFSLQFHGYGTPWCDNRCTMYIQNLRSHDRDGVSPVPEPSSMALLGSGLIGFVGFALKRNKTIA